MNDRSAAARPSDRFLTAYNAVDKHLQKVLAGEASARKRPPATSFVERVRLAGAMDLLSRRQVDDLAELADLRNAIVHDTLDRCIAEPHDEAIVMLERVRASLDRPVPVAKIGKPARTFSLEDPLSAVLEYMAHNDFSQVVVIKDYRIRVLTTESIALWLAHRVKDELVDLTEPVSAALEYELQGAFQCVRRDLPVEVAQQRFETAAASRVRRLYCLIVTINGKDTDRPERVVTPWDFT